MSVTQRGSPDLLQRRTSGVGLDIDPDIGRCDGAHSGACYAAVTRKTGRERKAGRKAA